MGHYLLDAEKGVAVELDKMLLTDEENFEYTWAHPDFADWECTAQAQNAKTAFAIVDWLSNPTVATPVHAAEARILAASIIRNMLIAAGIERP